MIYLQLYLSFAAGAVAGWLLRCVIGQNITKAGKQEKPRKDKP